MKKWVEDGDLDAPLNLSCLGLRTLPKNMPPVRHLDVACNLLTSLPDMAELQTLNAIENELSSLPSMPSLKKLMVSYNDLTTLPEGMDKLEELEATDNSLNSLPALPSLKKLIVSRNRLTSLPEGMSELKELYAGDNRLTSLPGGMPNLRKVVAERNRLTSLPEGMFELQKLWVSGNLLIILPAGMFKLEILDARGNQLISLPEDMPLLKSVNASNNRLTSLPLSLLQLPRTSVVNVQNNSFSERVIRNLQAVRSAAGYNGPRIDFSMATATDNTPARALQDAVAKWYGEDEQEAVRTTWGAFESEPGAPEFSRFLDRLQCTVSYTLPEFKEGVREELAEIASRPKLRKKLFLASFGATETCEDAVSYTRNRMTVLRHVQDIEDAKYDERLPELLHLLRELSRVDELKKIAEHKVRSLPFVDVLEVHVAFQVELRLRLLLARLLKTPKMRFFGVSGVTEQDLINAEKQVKHAENERFIESLSTSEDIQPAWNGLLARLCPDLHKPAQDKLDEIFLDLKPIEDKVRTGLIEQNYDPDNLNELGKEIQAQLRKRITDDIRHQIMGPVTEQFLARKDLSDLLASPWLSEQSASAAGTV